jgi:2,3-bisphosphoglycerate-dependent phosphoglycerate mutase
VKEIWLIRHGESEANAGLPTGDPFNVNLTKKGDRQAQRIAIALTQKPSLIVTSPYLRTKQTAKPTCDRFPSTAQVQWQVQEFTYLAPSRYQNTTISDRRPKVIEYWQKCDPLYIDGEEAESFANLIDRVRVFRDNIFQLNEPFAVVFSHGMFMRAVLWFLLANPQEICPKTMKYFDIFKQALEVPNAAIVKLKATSSEIWLSQIFTEHLSHESNEK